IATEAAPTGLVASTRSGLISGIGEIFGGGRGARHRRVCRSEFSGVPHVFYFALGGLALGVFVVLALVENGAST
ncbi:MFS transporter, partial [Paraburkholderia dipogonis]